jgi:hypothetical protein
MLDQVLDDVMREDADAKKLEEQEKKEYAEFQVRRRGRTSRRSFKGGGRCVLSRNYVISAKLQS